MKKEPRITRFHSTTPRTYDSKRRQYLVRQRVSISESISKTEFTKYVLIGVLFVRSLTFLSYLFLFSIRYHTKVHTEVRVGLGHPLETSYLM